MDLVVSCYNNYSDYLEILMLKLDYSAIFTIQALRFSLSWAVK